MPVAPAPIPRSDSPLVVAVTVGRLVGELVALGAQLTRIATRAWLRPTR